MYLTRKFQWVPVTKRCSRDVFFFFSSRRRHTRLQGDWSSDVCSSDLARAALARRREYAVAGLARGVKDHVGALAVLRRCELLPERRIGERLGLGARIRSEERRVGEEWSSRWAREREQKYSESWERLVG